MGVSVRAWRGLSEGRHRPTYSTPRPTGCGYIFSVRSADTTRSRAPFYQGLATPGRRPIRAGGQEGVCAWRRCGAVLGGCESGMGQAVRTR